MIWGLVVEALLIGAACTIVGGAIIYVQSKRIEMLADRELRRRREADDQPGRPWGGPYEQ